MTPELISETIREALCEKTMDDLAYESGIARETIRRWLNGTNDPGVSKLEAVLNCLGYELTIRRREK
jgi:DNA-binding phage protein